jgi:tRNA(Ile)-lysidine synthase
MHLLRGAGLSGLRGMAYFSLPNPWSQDIPLVRPLLGVWREQVMTYISRNNLNPVQDISNFDTRFYRNRLRHELVPHLENYNAGFRQVFWRMADTLAADYDIIQERVSSALKECVQDGGEGFLKMNRRSLLQYSRGVQRHLMRRAVGMLRPGLRDIDYAAVERAIGFFESPPTSGFSDLIAGLYLLVEGESVWLAAYEANLPHDNWPQLSGNGGWSMDIPGVKTLNDRWCLVTRLEEQDDQDGSKLHRLITHNNDPYQAWFDYDSLVLPLEVRTRLPGDRLQPLGMAGKSQSLADFMINVKLPRRARPAWPLICSNGQIVWLPGYRIGHAFRVRRNTQRIVRMALERC